jgi:hypothetical protein
MEEASGRESKKGRCKKEEGRAKGRGEADRKWETRHLSQSNLSTVAHRFYSRRI